MILSLFIVYKKVYTYIVVCIEHQQLQCRVRLLTLPIARSDDTHWLMWKIMSTSIATNLESPKRHKMKATFVTKLQQSTLVKKVSHGGEEK